MTTIKSITVSSSELEINYGDKPTSYNCTKNVCVELQDSSGKYQDKASCETACSVPVTSYNCTKNVCVEVQGSGGTYPDKASCETACSVPVTSYNCTKNVCVEVQGSGGTYPDKASCETACSVPVTSYNCTKNVCVEVQGSGGTYPDKASCETACSVPVTSYNCTDKKCVEVQGSGGTYPDKASCETACSGIRPYAPGMNRWPVDYGSKVMWMYVAVAGQGDACTNPLVDEILKTKVNYISMICNLSIQKPTDLIVYEYTVSGDPTSSSIPSSGNVKSSPCGQHQVTLPYSLGDLQKLHDNGVTIALCLGSWCSYFPNNNTSNGGGDDLQYWDKAGVDKFVDIFKKIREKYPNRIKSPATKSVGSCIDGIDIDWEGYCDGNCLENGCVCYWDAGCSGSGGMPLTSPNGKVTKCWSLIDETTIAVLNKIGGGMRAAGFTCTAVPMSTQLYGYNTKITGGTEKLNFTEKTANGQNQYIKYNIDFTVFDGIMLQWYSGFDGGICNAPQSDYPITDKSKAGMCDINSWMTNNNKNYSRNAPLHCPRDVDCPDWGTSVSEGFSTKQFLYATQLAFFQNLIESAKTTTTGSVVDADYISNKIIIGLEFWTANYQWGPEPRADYINGLDKALIGGFKSLESIPSGALSADDRNTYYPEYKDGPIATSGLAGFGGWTIYGTMDTNKYYNSSACKTDIYNKYAPPTTSDPTGDKSYEGCCPFPRWKYFRNQIEECGGGWGRDPHNNGAPVSVPTNNCSPPSDDLCGTMMKDKWTSAYSPLKPSDSGHPPGNAQ